MLKPVYLHLKASDRAGNTLTWDSGAYTVQAAPDGSLTLTLSGAPTRLDQRRCHPGVEAHRQN